MGCIGFLVSQYPAINHTIILHEIRKLRESLELRTVSIRTPDRSFDQLTPEERDESTQTYYIKSQGIFGGVVSLARTLLTRPGACLGALVYAFKMSRFRPLQALRNVAYWVEAAMVGQWMRREGICHLHAHYSSTIALLARRMFPIEISISFHGPDEFENPADFWLREKIEASKFIRAISHYASSQLMRYSTDWDKIEVAYMAVDGEVFSSRPFRPDANPLELICVGRLARVKAHRILIAAVREIVQGGDEVLLHIVGGGPERQALEQYVDELGVRRYIVFHGFTPQEKLNALYRGADVFVLSSLAEGLPGVLMEAMAMEIPCVSTWIAGIPEIIQDGVTGLLVPPSDAHAFAGAIKQLIDDPELRRKIGIAGRQRVIERFNIAANAKHLAGIFNRRTGADIATITSRAAAS